MSASNGHATSYGQVIEYIQDRIYLASYTHPPTAHTPFPYPQKRPGKSPNKKSSRQQGPAPSSGPKVHPPVYFSIDHHLLYNAFHADFGPLHIGYLFRFALQLHGILGDPANEDRGVVFWSNADSRSRANAACMLACYMVLIQSWPPHLALAPIAQMDPPCMPFRDAGYSQADYVLSIQDIVYGVWKAKEEGLCSLNHFNLEEYETFERVDMGDFNWITPSFLAFASPQHKPTNIIQPTDPLFATIPRTLAELHRRKDIPQPFKNVLGHFAQRKIGLVVRLNSELYSPSYFTALGITHMDMIFDDGTCPPLSLVKKFIGLASQQISKGRGIAVHCKAGLGRTGCLIGAYLIYRYGFTANEVIAFMRFMRPGMVVGPQQHWLHLNQNAFREWAYEEKYVAKYATQRVSTPTRARARITSNGQTFTPPNGSQKRAALGELDSPSQRRSASTIKRSSDHKSSDDTGMDSNLPAPTPGQPRKTARHASAYRHTSNYLGPNSEEITIHNDAADYPDTEIVSTHTHRPADADNEVSEEEFQLRMLARRRSQGSKSPSRSPLPSSTYKKAGGRSVSCTTTTTQRTTWDVELDSTSDTENQLADDVENIGMSSETKTPRTRDLSGKGGISVGKVRGSPSRRSTDGKTSALTAAGVRKTSGRVGSYGQRGLVK